MGITPTRRGSGGSGLQTINAVNGRQGCRKITLVAGGAASVDLHRALITALILGAILYFRAIRRSDWPRWTTMYAVIGTPVFWTIKPARHTTV